MSSLVTVVPNESAAEAVDLTVANHADVRPRPSQSILVNYVTQFTPQDGYYKCCVLRDVTAFVAAFPFATSVELLGATATVTLAPGDGRGGVFGWATAGKSSGVSAHARSFGMYSDLYCSTMLSANATIPLAADHPFGRELLAPTIHVLPPAFYYSMFGEPSKPAVVAGSIVIQWQLRVLLPARAFSGTSV